VNPTAVFKAALKPKDEPEHEDGGEVAEVQVPGLAGSVFDLIDDHGIDEELVAQLFKAGYMTIEQLLNVSREKLVELGADDQLVLLLKGSHVKRRKLDNQLALKPSSAPRADMPELRFVQRGSVKTALALLATDESKLQALQEVDKRRFANTTRKSKDSIWSTWEAMAKDVWQEQSLPLTEELVRKQAAAFYAGGYRSAAQYFARAKEEHLKVFKKPVSVSVLKAIKDYTRSTERGIGPSKLKDSIPFEDIVGQLVEVPPLQLPRDPEMCIWPAGMVCLGTWWLTRGIELAFAEVAHVTVNENNKTVAWMLPASKRDPKALGETRTQACVCIKVPSKAELCPFCIMVENINFVKANFGGDELGSAGLARMPLFPNSYGKHLSKAGTAATIRCVIAEAGHPVTKVDAEGNLRQRFGEHALRVIGAQFLARFGMDVYLIKLFARWGSDAVLRYIQDAQLADGTGTAARALAAVAEQEVHAIKDIVRDPYVPRQEMRDEILTVLSSRQAAENIEAVVDQLVRDRLKELKQASTAVVGTVKKVEADQLVVNLPTKKAHKVLVYDPEKAPETWQAFCGWMFGRAKYKLVTAVPKRCTQCKDCFPKKQGDTPAGAQSDSDSSSSSSSSSSSKST